MAAEVRPLASTSMSQFSERDVRGPSSGGQILTPDAAGVKPLNGGNEIICVALRRGDHVMALFRGSPSPSALVHLRQLKIRIGIALSSDELPTVQQLDGYCYAFVASRSQTASVLKLALADLARRNWTLDDATTLVTVSASMKILGS